MPGYGYKYADDAAERLGASDFIQLKADHDKFIGAIVGEPYVEEVVWNTKTNRNEKWSKEHEAAGKKPNARFYFNIYVLAEGNGKDLKRHDPPVVKKFNCSGKTFKRLRKVQEKFPQDKYFIEIERRGGKGDTDTTYEAVPDDAIPAQLQTTLTKALEAHMNYLKTGTKPAEGTPVLHDLSKAFGADEEEESSDAKTKSAANGLIETAVAEDFKKRLKILPRAQIDRFLARFGVGAIKDVKAEDAEKAKNFIEELEGKNSSPAAQAPENDPFA